MIGTLWIVSTPLGNLQDFSPRARQVLTEADLVLAEDTRRTGLLLKRLGIESKKLLSLHENNEKSRVSPVLGLLEEGRNIALASDAGTPLLSDPGYLLVRAARQAGIPVKPIPGPSAPVAALSVAGLPPVPFAFLGFLPKKSGDVQRLLQRFAESGATLIFFTRKNRLDHDLKLVRSILGNREIFVAREMTKLYEEYLFIPAGSSPQDVLDFSGLKGEITVVIGPRPQISEEFFASGEFPEEDALLNLSNEFGESEFAEALRLAALSGEKPKLAAKRLALRFTQFTASEIYQRILQFRDQ